MELCNFYYNTAGMEICIVDQHLTRRGLRSSPYGVEKTTIITLPITPLQSHEQVHPDHTGHGPVCIITSPLTRRLPLGAH